MMKNNPSRNLPGLGRIALRLLMLWMLTFACATAPAQEIRITGKVTNTKGELLMGVNVLEGRSGKKLATTTPDGSFAINVHPNGTLRFTMVGAEPKLVKVKNRTYIEVQLTDISTELGEAEKVVHKSNKKITVEQTQIEIRGDTFIVNTQLQVPDSLFKKNMRVTGQAIIHNSTRRELTPLKPLVYDGYEYNDTQERMYDFDLRHGDPMGPYVRRQDAAYRWFKKNPDNAKGKKEKATADRIQYREYAIMKNKRDMYWCDFYTIIENYDRIVYRDTVNIARGVLNPLHFLDYAITGSEVSDSSYFPKGEPQLKNTNDEVNLVFPVGKSRLDPDNPQNRAELERMQARLASIRQEPNASIYGLSVTGTASPEGIYSSNVRLANERMKSALAGIMQILPADMSRNIESQSHARVAGWDEVAALLRQDSLFAEAEAVERIIARNSNIDVQGRQMRQLPFYRSLLLETYLPRLRKVEYKIEYSIYRNLTVEEIRQLYKNNGYQNLMDDEFFRLYRAETDLKQKEIYLRQALEVYPQFMVAANDLQVLLINRHEPDVNLLARFVGAKYRGLKVPPEVNMNHICALLNEDSYSDADTLAVYLLPDDAKMRFVKALVQAYNGHYEEAYPIISQTELRNDIVMLLAMKRNKEALQKSKQLDDSKAEHLYLKAICMNRSEDPEESIHAQKTLMEAIKKDPTLEKYAERDADVNGLLPKFRKFR